jgi:hypothetical protein
MSQHRTDLNHTSRRVGRAKAEAAKGGGAPAPACVLGMSSSLGVKVPCAT